MERLCLAVLLSACAPGRQNIADAPSSPVAASAEQSDPLPKPTPQYRRRAWLEFQRALDPLAPVKPLRVRRPL